MGNRDTRVDRLPQKLTPRHAPIRGNRPISAISSVAYRLLWPNPSGPRPGGSPGAVETTRRGWSGTRVSRALAAKAACRFCRRRILRWKRAPICFLSGRWGRSGEPYHAVPLSQCPAATLSRCNDCHAVQRSKSSNTVTPPTNPPNAANAVGNACDERIRPVRGADTAARPRASDGVVTWLSSRSSTLMPQHNVTTWQGHSVTVFSLPALPAAPARPARLVRPAHLCRERFSRPTV